MEFWATEEVLAAYHQFFTQEKGIAVAGIAEEEEGCVAAAGGLS